MSGIIITGATGFLGGVLARRLAASGEHVMAVGRSKDKLGDLQALGIEAHSLDLSDPQSPLPGVKADAIVHCAALSTPWGRREAFLGANVTGTRTAIALARAAGVNRLIHVSTPSLYFRFEDQDSVQEDSPLPQPVNAYADSKLKAEALVLAASDLDPIILRPRGLYGVGDTSLLPRLLRAAAGRPLPLMRGGRAATDLTHVDDLVGSVLAALHVSRPDRRIFNISGGQALRVRDIAERAGKLAGVSVRWRSVPVGLVRAYARSAETACALLPGRPEPPITEYGVGLFAYRQTLDISEAARGLGWRPSIDFDEGLRRTFV
ncbi:MAG: NAD(P)-dependent oxidoreductase [Leptolyngbya sp.]|nr:NAD(P)-dependent oxidoreductase [Leptolyngbya sp.]